MKIKSIMTLFFVLTVLCFGIGGYLLYSAMLFKEKTNSQITQALRELSQQRIKLQNKPELARKILKKTLPIISKTYEQMGCKTMLRQNELAVICSLEKWKKTLWILETLHGLPIDIKELCFGEKCKGCRFVLKLQKI